MDGTRPWATASQLGLVTVKPSFSSPVPRAFERGLNTDHDGATEHRHGSQRVIDWRPALPAPRMYQMRRHTLTPYVSVHHAHAIRERVLRHTCDSSSPARSLSPLHPLATGGTVVHLNDTETQVIGTEVYDEGI